MLTDKREILHIKSYFSKHANEEIIVNKRVKSIFGIFRFRKVWYVYGGNRDFHCRYSISPLQRLLSI